MPKNAEGPHGVEKSCEKQSKTDQNHNILWLKQKVLHISMQNYNSNHRTHEQVKRMPKGIVVGCKRRLSVNAKVFGISGYEFSVYVKQLVEVKLIEKHEVDGIEYYYSTLKADSLTDNQIYKAVKDLAGTVAEAATRAVTEKLLNP